MFGGSGRRQQLYAQRSELGFGLRNLSPIAWVAVKELKLSYHIGETLLFIIYTHYGNLI